MRISRIRLSDKTSRIRPRRAAPAPGQTYESEVPVEVREWISPASASPDDLKKAQAPAPEVFVPALAAWPAAQPRPAPPAMLPLAPTPALN